MFNKILGLILLLFSYDFLVACAPVIAAAPLPAEDVTDALSRAGMSSDKQAYATAYKLIDDSESSCNKFLSNLTGSEDTTLTAFDVSSTVTSGIGSLFSPIAVAHSFSAATTVLTGSRAEVDADVFAQAAAPDFAQAIRTTYYANMQAEFDYVEKLEHSKPIQQIDPADELVRVEYIHEQCSLAAGEEAVKSALTTTTPPAGASTKSNQPKTSAVQPAQPAASAAAPQAETQTPNFATTLTGPNAPHQFSDVDTSDHLIETPARIPPVQAKSQIPAQEPLAPLNVTPPALSTPGTWYNPPPAGN